MTTMQKTLWNFCSIMEQHYIPASDCSTFQASCKMVESRGHHRELSVWGERKVIRKRRGQSQKYMRAHQPCTLWELTLLFHPGIHTSAWTTQIWQTLRQIHTRIGHTYLRLLVVCKQWSSGGSSRNGAHPCLRQTHTMLTIGGKEILKSHIRKDTRLNLFTLMFTHGRAWERG